MRFQKHILGILAAGLTELPAWGQAPFGVPERPRESTEPASEPRPATTAVAAFPDVTPPRPSRPRDEALDLLATDPYAADLALLQARRNLYGPGIDDDDDPYADALRLVNPYTESVQQARTDDLSNPYETARGR